MIHHKILLTGLFSSIAIAQSIIPSSQPSCINSCSPFTQAQQACSGDSGQAALYQSCFCQSAYLATIKTTPSNSICLNCAASDWTTIASWYNGLCGGGTAAAAPAAGGQNTLTTVTTPVVAGGPTTTAANGAAATTAGSGSDVASLASDNNPATYTDGQGWFRTHWQWVVMIIVLAVAFTAIGVIGTIIHKRKSRAKQQGRNNTAPMSSNPAVNSWAPSRHSVHDFGTPRNTSPAPPLPAAAATVGSRRQSRRIGKSPLST